MGKQNKDKINHLDSLLDEGLLAPTWWLEDQGYSRPLLAKYVANGRLVSPAHGVFRRPGPSLKWQHMVASLQLLMGSFLHVGGHTALVHGGLGHYVRMRGSETILLYGPEQLPHWVNKIGLSERFAVHNDAMFGALRARRNAQGEMEDSNGHALTPKQLREMGLVEKTWGAWDWPLCYSMEERAILEVLQDVPARESVYEAYTLMQGLSNLRPELLNRLLHACTSVKVKRLFLALAERHSHAWFRHLEISKFDLGTGKRMITPGGKLHPRFNVTLPVDLDAHAR